jgi:hypothetical protein
MKASFKPLSLAIAVSAASAGYVGTINAQPELAGNTGLGDLAIVPYYTVREDWTTGVSVINTSASTQVIKIRLRRATDSMDALDFNVVLSPQDVWTGYVENNTPDTGVEDQIRFYTNDKSCTVPAATANDGGVPYFAVPDVFAEDAEEGYIEIIGMGAANAAQPISADALHDGFGVPADCVALQQNFNRLGVINQFNQSYASQAVYDGLVGAPTDGNVNSVQTLAQSRLSEYTAPGNFMKVSYFIKDTTSGIEFGDNAAMVSDFMTDASMTNQVAALEGVEDLQGYDYPDLNGGAPLSFDNGVGANDMRFNLLRGILGSTGIINDWSRNTVAGEFSVDTDWVITAPGQYVMLDLPVYIASLTGSGTCAASCDYRDLPLTIAPAVYDREEQVEFIPPGGIVISPTPSNPTPPGTLPFEVNVIQWGASPVLDAAESVKDLAGDFDASSGWANLALTSTTTKTQQVCQYTVAQDVVCAPATGSVPIVGFAAWQRNFGGNPDANYGRIVRHSYTVSS